MMPSVRPACTSKLTPLSAGDVAECIRWAASLPSHVNIDTIVVKPRDQADAFRSHRSTP